MNETIMIGRLAKDVELRSTKEGKAVANFVLAVDRGKKDAGADFVPVIVWDKLAELVKQYCSKGDMVAIRGHIQVRPYEKDGQKRTSTEVVAEEVKFLSTKRKEAAPEEVLPY